MSREFFHRILICFARCYQPSSRNIEIQHDFQDALLSDSLYDTSQSSQLQDTSPSCPLQDEFLHQISQDELSNAQYLLSHHILQDTSLHRMSQQDALSRYTFIPSHSAFTEQIFAIYIANGWNITYEDMWHFNLEPCVLATCTYCDNTQFTLCVESTILNRICSKCWQEKKPQ